MSAIPTPAAAPRSDSVNAGGLRSLFTFFHEHRSSGSPLVLATVVATAGTTYRKRGAQMLIRNDNQWHGLLSGGCLEGDLAAHATEIFAGGQARIIDYALSAMTDAVWGFGLGCDGSVRILLQRLDAANAWEPYASIVEAVERGASGRLVLLCSSTNPAAPVGLWSLHRDELPATGPLASLLLSLPSGLAAQIAEQADIVVAGQTYECVGFPLPHLPRLIILGGGPDAVPLTQFAAQMGWHVVVADHRPAYADPGRFPCADRVVLAPDQVLPADLDLSSADAIVIMSHNLAADERYVSLAAQSRAPYVGLLGPAARKAKLLSTLPEAFLADGRFRGPVGLDLGGEGPESIALSIVAEIQAVLHGKAFTREER
ncbi:MAG: XdhC family protein [Steroidobacteraceae bacterium]